MSPQLPGSVADMRFETPRPLHPATLLLPLLRFLIRLALPLLIAVFWIKVGGVLLALWVVPAAALYFVVKYLTFRYSADQQYLVIRSGWLSLAERRIPLERIQELGIRQEWYYRPFGLARVEISTAGTEELEADLDVVSLAEALALKRLVDARQGGAAVIGQPEALAGRVLVQLTPKDLLLGGLTSDLVSRLGALAGAVFYFYGVLSFFSVFKPPWEYLPLDFERLLPQEGVVGIVLRFVLEETVAKAVGLILLGFGYALLRYAVRYFGFRVTRSGSVLETAHGLFSHRRSTLRCDRIQALRVEESLLRRWFRLATISVDSAGDRRAAEDPKKAEVLVPLLAASRVPELINELMPGLGTQPPEWQSVSPKAIWRGCRKGWLVVGVMMLLTGAALGWAWLIWTPAIPLVYLLNLMWYRHTGYCLRSGYLLSRKGWLTRQTLVQPVANIQNLRLRENWFERRADLAALSIDAAGQTNTGGGAFLRNLPVGEARRLQTQLACEVAQRPFSW